jgi:hypothetical protein
MPNELDKAIESLQNELLNLDVRQVEIKKAINQLMALNGLPPKYADIEQSNSNIGKYEPPPREFVGKSMLDSTKEFLRKTGRASTAQEILDGLTKGDFQFPSTWKAKHSLKNMAIFLGSNREFVQFDTQDGKAYGLAERYPDKVKEREKKNNGGEVEKTVVDTEKIE